MIRISLDNSLKRHANDKRRSQHFQDNKQISNKEKLHRASYFWTELDPKWKLIIFPDSFIKDMNLSQITTYLTELCLPISFVFSYRKKIHSFIDSLIHSFIHSFILSLTHSLIHSLTLPIHSLSLIHSFIHSFIHRPFFK